MNSFLIAVSGANRDILAKAPGDRVKQAALGGVLLTTAALAAVSATFALHMALKAPTVVAMLFGAAWGLAILNLDRWLVVATTRQATAWKNVKMAVPRLLFALIIGLIVSTPVTLQIFEREINTELTLMQAEDLEEFQEQQRNSPRVRELAAMQFEIRELEARQGSDGVAAEVLADPRVIDLTTRLRTLETAYDEAEQAVVCEKEGTCGSGRAGAGIAFREKEAKRNRLLAERDALRAELAEAKRAATDVAGPAAARQRAADEARLDDLRARAGTAQSALDKETAGNSAAVRDSGGLLARLEALHHISTRNGTLAVAHGALLLLFTLLECLPVIFKLILLLGRPSLYEQLTVLGEEAALSEQQLSVDTARQQRELTAKTTLEAHEARVRNQLQAEVEAAQEVLAAQLALAKQAVARWRGQQEDRIESDLDSFVTTAMVPPQPTSADHAAPQWRPAHAPGPTAGDPRMGSLAPPPLRTGGVYPVPSAAAAGPHANPDFPLITTGRPSSLGKSGLRRRFRR